MTRKIVCPQCNSPSYTTSSEVFGPCPYCCFVFNWRSPDRRLSERVKKEALITLEFEGELYDTEVEDISKGGAGIIFHSQPFVKDGDKIRCKINANEEMRDAKVVWSEKSKDTQRIGLLFT